MTVPREHRDYLVQRGFPVPPYVAGLSRHHRRLLQRHGFWLKALAEGKIKPFTLAQIHFVAVAQGKLTPETPYEIAWRTLSVAKHAADTYNSLSCQDRHDWYADAEQWDDLGNELTDYADGIALSNDEGWFYPDDCGEGCDSIPAVDVQVDDEEF